MFSWIALDSVLFWIWFAGFCVMSLPVFFIWAINSAFLGDSMNAWYRRKMFIWFTFLGFVMTWFWPIGLIGFGIYESYDAVKQRRWDKKWAEKKATVPNYWRDVYLILDGNVTDIQCRVLDWEYSKYLPGKARLALWRGDSRFWCEGKEVVVWWPNKDLELIPEKDAKV
jgi:hypothetical protein